MFRKQTGVGLQQEFSNSIGNTIHNSKQFEKTGHKTLNYRYDFGRARQSDCKRLRIRKMNLIDICGHVVANCQSRTGTSAACPLQQNSSSKVSKVM